MIDTLIFAGGLLIIIAIIVLALWLFQRWLTEMFALQDGWVQAGRQRAWDAAERYDGPMYRVRDIGPHNTLRWAIERRSFPEPWPGDWKGKKTPPFIPTLLEWHLVQSVRTKEEALRIVARWTKPKPPLEAPICFDRTGKEIACG